jgi:putative ABC transport system permease protein
VRRLILIAVRNVLRRPRRTAITCAAVAIGMACMVVGAGFVDFTLWGLRESIVYGGLGHLQILPVRADPRARLAAPSVREMTSVLRASPEVAVIAPRIEFQGLVSAGPRTVAFSGVGVDPLPEARLRVFTMLVAGQWITGAERVPHALIGRGLAERLHVRPRDVVALIGYSDRGNMNAIDVEVAGVFESGVLEYDARTLIVPLTAARDLMQTNGSSSITVALQDAGATPVVVARMRRLLDVRGISARVAAWDDLSPVYASVVGLYRWVLNLFLVIIALVVVLGIANTMSMAVLERTPEVGVLRALGFGPWRVVAMFLAESVTIGILGAVSGTALGAAACVAISSVGIEMPPPPGHSQGYVAQVHMVPAAFASAVVIVVAAAIVAALVPSTRLIRGEVSDALRAT